MSNLWRQIPRRKCSQRSRRIASFRWNFRAASKISDPDLQGHLWRRQYQIVSRTLKTVVVAKLVEPSRDIYSSTPAIGILQSIIDFILYRK